MIRIISLLTWANESWADGQFEKMRIHFIDQGYGVIFGEYGTLARTGVVHHAHDRLYYTEYVTQSMIDHGPLPFIWDNGATGNMAWDCSIVRRAPGSARIL